MSTPNNKIPWVEAPAFGRTGGIKYALELLQVRKPEGATIIETGTSRGLFGGGIVGDGEATPAFAWYSKKYKGTIHTIDTEESCLMECKKLVAMRVQGPDEVVYHHGMGCDVIPSIEGEIDLLYLDSADDPQISLGEFNSAKDKFTPQTILFMDDMHHDGDGYKGKGQIIHRMLIESGEWKVVYDEGYQVIMVKE